ncbi:MAG: TlpA family protein disulfide reductase [Tannerellaceae bacterium]|nr:TlpA family protein disulfide reductase [Tannerellaceae bacterium]
MKIKLLSIIMSLSLLSAHAQNRENIKINTYPPEKIQDIKGGTVYNMTVSQTWPQENHLPVDSVLLSSTIRWNHENYLRLHTFAKHANDSLYIGLLKRDNALLREDYLFAYQLDSVKKWNSMNLSSYFSSRIDIPLMDDSIQDTLEIYLSPVTMFSFTDQRINNFPVALVGSDAKYRIGELKDSQLHFAIPNGAVTTSELTLRVVEKGEDHRDKTVKNFRYKDSYVIGDTICLDEEFYLFQAFDLKKKEACFQRLTIQAMDADYIPQNAWKRIKPYFPEGKQFLLIDFWGTWCVPCIASLPHMVDLYEELQEDFAFLGICFDENENQEKAKSIYEKHTIKWTSLFEDMSSPVPWELVTFMLKVTAFPTCIVIDKEGKICLRVTGFAGLQKHLKDIYDYN